jgi:hypothetical protein
LRFRNWAAILVILLAPARVHAECAGSRSGPKDWKKHTPFVFEATIRELIPVGQYEMAAKIETHRVWKGTVPTQTSIHFLPNIDGPHFRTGERYVIFGVEETDAAPPLSSFGNQAHRGTIWVNPCTPTQISSPRLIEQLGRSRKPS